MKNVLPITEKKKKNEHLKDFGSEANFFVHGYEDFKFRPVCMS